VATALPVGTSLQSLARRFEWISRSAALVKLACSPRPGVPRHRSGSFSRAPGVAGRRPSPLPPRPCPSPGGSSGSSAQGPPSPCSGDVRCASCSFGLSSRALSPRWARPPLVGFVRLSPLRRSTLRVSTPEDPKILFGRTEPSARSCSAFAVSHRLDGFLHPGAAGLSRPAADHEVRRVSVVAPTRSHRSGSWPWRAFPTTRLHTPRRMPLAGSRTASPRPLPSWCCCPLQGSANADPPRPGGRLRAGRAPGGARGVVRGPPGWARSGIGCGEPEPVRAIPHLPRPALAGLLAPPVPGAVPGAGVIRSPEGAGWWILPRGAGGSGSAPVRDEVGTSVIRGTSRSCPGPWTGREGSGEPSMPATSARCRVTSWSPSRPGHQARCDLSVACSRSFHRPPRRPVWDGLGFLPRPGVRFQRAVPGSSTSERPPPGPCSTDESVVTAAVSSDDAPCPSMGFASPPRSSRVRSPSGCAALSGVSSAEASDLLHRRESIPPAVRVGSCPEGPCPCAAGVCPDGESAVLAGAGYPRVPVAAWGPLTSMGFLTSKNAPRSASSVAPVPEALNLNFSVALNFIPILGSTEIVPREAYA
jgi:hypothetical protein